MNIKRGALYLLVAAVLFGSGSLAALAYGRGLGSTSSDGRLSSRSYPLLAKRLFVDDPNDPVINFANLRKQLTEYFNTNSLSGSLYFEYLPTGTSARITADTQEVAASLMKLPAAMDLYKAAENGKIDLDKKIPLQAAWLDDRYGDLYKQGAGYQISMRDAAKIMLEKSDNTALRAVGISSAGLIEPGANVLAAVDIDLTENRDLTVSIGARSYSSFLKCLYFACYNTPEHSQELLEYLTRSQFNDRMMAGIADKSVKVAHKIGVYESVQSDCGIVYVPSRNYVFCAMIAGPDNATTSKRIADLSRLAYDYVKKQ